MATKKDKTEKATLKKGIALASPEAEEAAKRLAKGATTSETADLTSNLTADGYTRVRISADIPPDRLEKKMIYAGEEFNLTAVLESYLPETALSDYGFTWNTDAGNFIVKDPVTGTVSYVQEADGITVKFSSKGLGEESINIDLTAVLDDLPNETATATLNLTVRMIDWTELKLNLDKKLDNITSSIENSKNLHSTVPVSLQRTSIPRTPDVGLWVVIRNSTQAIGFDNYLRFMDLVLYGIQPSVVSDSEIDDINNINLKYQNLRKIRALPFNDTDAYRLLKVATEAFLLINGGVKLENFDFTGPGIISDLDARLGGTTDEDMAITWKAYLNSVNSTVNPVLPYLALVSQKFGNETLKNQVFRNQPTLENNFDGDNPEFFTSLGSKLIQPFLVELIWSYWHEEGMLVQTMNAIARRFQNVRGPSGSRDPLANLEIDPLRPLNNLLWGYVQDEQHRLSLLRRVYEYEHQYGIALQGKAVPKLRPADSRSKFLEAFHHLLHLCSVFFKQDDDTTVNSDGFPILNALREVHLILSQGAHNQFGDLPSTARQEMLIQQWLLARPEFREFLPTRNMVAYPEPWMDRVDAMKMLQGWTDISIDHFNRLAVFGEQILLSIRFGAWSRSAQSSPSAANWARFWRAEIQGYIHDYRAVTGVDLTSSSKVDSIPPSVHLFKRYLEQARR